MNFNSVVHLLGRDYSDESTFEYVESCNPFLIDVNSKEDTKSTKVKSKVTMNTLRDFGMLK